MFVRGAEFEEKGEWTHEESNPDGAGEESHGKEKISPDETNIERETGLREVRRRLTISSSRIQGSDLRSKGTCSCSREERCLERSIR